MFLHPSVTAGGRFVLTFIHYYATLVGKINLHNRSRDRATFVMKLKEYFDSFISYERGKGMTEHTIREHERFLGCLSLVADKDVQDLRKVDDVLVIQGGKPHGEYGPQRAVCLFRILLKYIEDTGVRLPFRWESIPVPYVRDKDQYYLTPGEFESFVARMPDTFYGIRDRALYELLWSTGCRIGEALGIEMKDINFEEKEIFVHTEKDGDGDKVYISDRLEIWLKKYIERKKGLEMINGNCSHLFVNFFLGDMKKLDRINARKNLASYRKKFKIEKKMDHPSFRRGFATNVIENGATIKEVQFLARHRSERTTLRHYIKFDKMKVRNVHNRIYSREAKNFALEVMARNLDRKEEE